ncbi:hypothetical protein M8C13_05310 [Crossiella sp. SN42]|uniref:MAB_1171c family putative transporter n=1 Tax=Crossiella sp. SN42 TaxID=2944808 RepID=UPI00207D1495|nr:MAB_1171c family putative transporter [Crossiella sp. SN42]MCO1575177.1 hypothetical protein [Crossiella sp. SN42]
MIFYIFYFLCAIGTLALVAHKYRSWRAAPAAQRPAILPLCTSGICVAIGFLVAVPLVGVNLNKLTGIPSLSVIVIGVVTMGWVGSGQVMLLYWRYSPARAWRGARWILSIYGAIAVTQVVLFVLGGPPADLHLEFLVTYPAAPFFGEQMALHFLAYTVGMANIAYMCWRWTAEPTTAGRAWLRRGLRITAVGILFGVAYGTVTFIAIIATWFDQDLSLLSTHVGPSLNILSAPLVIMGMSIPVWGPKLPISVQKLADYPDAVRDHQRLLPLWRALQPVDPELVHQQHHLGSRFQASSRLFWRVIEINDWLQLLEPYRSARTAAAIADRIREADLTDAQAQAYQEAAEIKAALAAYERGERSADVTTVPEHGAAEQAHHAFAAERARLTSIAAAFRDPGLNDLVAASTAPVASTSDHAAATPR